MYRYIYVAMNLYYTYTAYMVSIGQVEWLDFIFIGNTEQPSIVQPTEESNRTQLVCRYMLKIFCNVDCFQNHTLFQVIILGSLSGILVVGILLTGK